MQSTPALKNNPTMHNYKRRPKKPSPRRPSNPPPHYPRAPFLPGSGAPSAIPGRRPCDDARRPKLKRPEYSLKCLGQAMGLAPADCSSPTLHVEGVRKSRLDRRRLGCRLRRHRLPGPGTRLLTKQAPNIAHATTAVRTRGQGEGIADWSGVVFRRCVVRRGDPDSLDYWPSPYSSARLELLSLPTLKHESRAHS